MTPSRWAQVSSLYHAAADLTTEARNSLFAKVEPGLRAEVESLLSQPDVHLSPPFELPGASETETISYSLPSSGPFQPGTLVAGRFRIEAKVAEGGMGIVYRATDETLHQPRALKVAKSGFGGHLPPEVRNAVRVTHPNVCRVFDFHTAQTPEGPVDFLSMELIDGTTLSGELSDKGPFKDREAVTLATQICAGLAALHAQNLLHRDLKPNNVLITRVDNNLRAVVTDFGLTQEAAPPSSAEQSSQTTMAGTRAYLAPERWRGEPSSVATDIFALGIVLHEIITGRRPKGDREEPRQVDADIPSRWRGVIQRCLAQDPRQRFSSAEEVADNLAGRAARRRNWTMAAAGFLVAALAGWRLLAPAPSPARLAILPFEAPGADARTTAIVRGAAFDLSSQLVLRHPPASQLVLIPLEESQNISAEQPALAQKRLGATHVLRSTVAATAHGLLLRSAIVATSNQVVLREVSAELASPSEIAPRLSALVAGAFNLSGNAPQERVNAAAYPYYADGLDRLRRRADFSQIVPLFQKSAENDPASPLPHARLAETFSLAWERTSDAKWISLAREEVDRAVALAPDSLAVHLAAGTLNVQTGSLQRAVEEFQRATRLAPSSAEAWMGLARAYQGSEDHRSDAADAYLKAVQLQPDYFVPVSRFAEFQRAMGNYQEAETLWKRAIGLAPESPLLHSNLGGLYADMGQWPQAEKELNLAIALEPGLRLALNNLGGVYQYEGRDADAVKVFERARLSGQESYILALNLGDSYRRLRNRVNAAEAYRRGQKLVEDRLLANPGDAGAHAFEAYFLMRLGEKTLAAREMVEALHFAPKDKTVLRRGAIYYESVGQREKAIEILQSATPDLVRELGRQPDLVSLRNDPRFRAIPAAPLRN